MESLLNQIWVKNNYSTNANRIYKEAKEKNKKVTLKKVDEFLSSKGTTQVLRKPTKQKFYNTVYAKGPGSNLMIDTMVYSRHQYKQYQYIFNCIDIDSRYAVSIPMTNKRIPTYISAMKKVFKKMNHVPEIIQADNEFAKKDFMDAMEKEGVKDFSFSQPNDKRHNSIVERYNKTLAQMLQQWRVATGNKDWVGEIDRIVDLYNSRVHTVTDKTPDNIWQGKAVNTQKIVIVHTNLKVGDKVRYKEEKKVFDKGDMLSYSKDVFEIVERKGIFNTLKNTKTDKISSKKYRDEDLIKASETSVQTTAQTRKKTKEASEESKHKEKKQLEKELKKLKGNGTKSKFEEEVTQLTGRGRTRASKQQIKENLRQELTKLRGKSRE
jgi:hypothetical protein